MQAQVDKCYNSNTAFDPIQVITRTKRRRLLLRLLLSHDVFPHRHPRTLKHLLQLALCMQRV